MDYFFDFLMVPFFVIQELDRRSPCSLSETLFSTEKGNMVFRTTQV